MSLLIPSCDFVRSVPVTVRPRTFEQAVKQYVMPEGLTFAEIIARIDDLPVEFWQLGVVRVGGQYVPRDLWHCARPKIGPNGSELVVELYMLPAGGGSLLQIVASVALLALTAFLPQPFGALVGIAGKLLLGLLFAPHQPKDPKQPRDAISYGVSGNPAKPLEQLERVLGKVQASPPYLANPYSTLVDQDVFVEGVIGLCGNHQVSNILFNGTDIDQNEVVVEYQVREGDPSDTAITIANLSAFEERPGQTLQNFIINDRKGISDQLKDQDHPEKDVPTWASFTMRGGGDEFAIRTLFPGGLVVTDPPDLHPAGVPVRLQFRRSSEDDWINGPEFHFIDITEIAQEIRCQIRLIWAVDPGYDDFEGSHHDISVSEPNQYNNAYVAFHRASPGETWEWRADDYFQPDGGIHAQHVNQANNSFNVYLDPAVFPRDEYEVRLKRGRTYVWTAFDAIGYQYIGSPLYADFFEYVFSGGVYKIDPNHSQTVMPGTTIIDAITTKSNEYPLPLPADMPLTLIAVKVKNGNINSISALFQSRVNTWNGVDWSTYEPSSNPAALYRHVLKDDLNAKPLDLSVINDAVLQSWYADCVARGFECNTIAADSVENVLALVATPGWAVPRQNEKWSVIVEHDRAGESILQNFTPLNSRGFQASKSFDDIPDAIYAEFQDETHDYRTHNRTVYGDGHDATTATLFQSIQYKSITDPSQIDHRALMDWRQMRFRQTRRTIEISAESLLSQRGDLVGLTHDVVGEKYFYGLVDAVLTSGGNVTGLRLNAIAQLSQAGGACGAWVRFNDETNVEAAIRETTDTDVITFVTPFAIPVGSDGNPVLIPDCLVALGKLGQVYKRMLIFDVRPAKDFGAVLTLIDEAPEIFAGPGLSLDFSQAKNSIYLPIAA